MLAKMSRRLLLGVTVFLAFLLASCHLVFPYGASAPASGESRVDAPAARDVALGEPAATDSAWPGKDLDAARSDAPPREAAASDKSGTDSQADAPRKKDAVASSKDRGVEAAVVVIADGGGGPCLTSWGSWKPLSADTACGTSQCCYSCQSGITTLSLKCDSTGFCVCFDGVTTFVCGPSPDCQAAWSAGCCKGL